MVPMWHQWYLQSCPTHWRFLLHTVHVSSSFSPAASQATATARDTRQRDKPLGPCTRPTTLSQTNRFPASQSSEPPLSSSLPPFFSPSISPTHRLPLLDTLCLSSHHI